MNSWFDRLKQSWQRTFGGGQEPLETEPGQPEDLAQRTLATPPTDVFENEEELRLVADVPGAEPDLVGIYWDEQRGLQIHVRQRPERGMADWYRAFRLPPYLEPHKAKSVLKDGVLTIAVPRRPSAKPVAIPVRAG